MPVHKCFVLPAAIVFPGAHHSHPITWQKHSQKNADHGGTSDAKSEDGLFSALEISTQVFAKEISLVSNKQV